MELSTRLQPVSWVAWGLVVGIVTAWLLILIGRYGFNHQVVFALALAATSLALVTYLWKPHVLICSYVLVLPLLPDASGDALNLGQVATLLVFLLTLPGLVLQRRRFPQSLWSVVWPFLTLSAVGLLSILVNSVTAPADIANAVFKYAVFGLVGLIVYAHIDTESKALGLMRVALFGAAGVAVFSILEYATGRSYYPEYGFSRASGTFEHWNQLGGYCALMVFGMFAHAMGRHQIAIRLAALLGVLALLLAMLLSLTLGSVLGVTIAIITGLALFFRRSWAAPFTLVLLTAMVLMVVLRLVPALGEHFAAADSRVEDRVGTYRVGLHLLRENLFLGLGSQSQVLEEVTSARAPGLPRVSVVPHNAFLGVGVEKGVFGVVLLAILMLNVLRLLLRERHSLQGWYRPWHIGIALGSIALLVQSMSNLLLLHARIGIIWMVLLALDIRLQDFSCRARTLVDGRPNE